MSGSGRNNEKEGEGGGGWGTFWKVAGAAAVVAGGIYSIAEHMEAKRVPVGAGGGGRGGGIGGGRGGGIGGSGRGGCDTIDGDGDSDSDSDSDDDGGGYRGIYSIIVGQMEANRVPVEAGGSGSGGGSSSGGSRGGGGGCGTGDSDSDDDGDGGLQTKEISVWTKPKVGWLKLNVAGSLLREIQSAGCGGVLRNNSGSWICGFAQKLSPSSREDETEKKGILKGLQWAKEKGFMRVEVESDNEGIVEKVNSWSRSTDPLILAIRELLRSPDWQTTLTWIPGGANGVADKLADIGRNLTSFDLKEYDYPPASCLTALNNDLRLHRRKLPHCRGGGRGGGGGCGTPCIDGDRDSDGDGGLQTKEISVWTTPKVGWLKLNVDGSLLREIQSAGCGGVLRNESGKWLIGFAQKLDPSLRVDETEIEGILRGLKWAKEKGVSKLEVESDNKGIVDMVNDGTKSKDRRIVDIREELLRSHHWQAKLTWIYGDANGVADKLADIGRNLTSFDLKEFDDPPTSCLTALTNDSRRLSN